jgi:hypothetical protein
VPQQDEPGPLKLVDVSNRRLNRAGAGIKSIVCGLLSLIIFPLGSDPRVPTGIGSITEVSWPIHAWWGGVGTWRLARRTAAQAHGGEISPIDARCWPALDRHPPPETLSTCDFGLPKLYSHEGRTWACLLCKSCVS